MVLSQGSKWFKSTKELPTLYIFLTHMGVRAHMLIFDIEVFKYNYMLTWLDTKTQKMYTIHDDRDLFKRMYNHYKDQIWVGFNSRRYDVPVMQGILAGFDPYEINDWIINQDRHGWEFSTLLRDYPILAYDCMTGYRGLKDLELFMGLNIKETSVPFDIDRPLTRQELQEVKEYNQADVWATFLVFLETKEEFESHIGLIKEFNLPMWNISRTKAQISAEILGAEHPSKPWNDEFDIQFIPTLQLGKYEYVKKHYENWAKNIRDYDNINLETDIAGVPTIVSGGGIHGAIDGYMDTGNFILADVSGYYPALMIEHGFLSRNVRNPKLFKDIRDERIRMKKAGDPREYPRKIVLNGTFGASKYKFNKLFDPRQANNQCFNGQLALIDLIEKLEGIVSFCQYNTDGILFKVHNKADEPRIFEICKEWEVRNKFKLDYERYNKVIQSNVNNYILVADNYIVTTGSVVKERHSLDNDLPIIQRAVVDYFVKGTSPRETIYASDKLIDFQKITKISRKYDFGFHEVVGGKDKYSYKTPRYRIRQGEKYLAGYDTHNFTGTRLHEKVIRCFASTDPRDGSIYKKHKDKDSLDKTPSTPERAFIDNGDIRDKPIPRKLDKEYYVKLAERMIREFLTT